MGIITTMKGQAMTSERYQVPDLNGVVAVVAGATRGCGRGIAVELGAAGATVYCTGRSTRQHRSPVNRPETIEETAEMVTQAGGRGIAVRVDHTEPSEVQALVSQVEAEQGQLDVWVSSVWGGESLLEWGLPLWDMDVEKATLLLKQAVLSHVLSAHAALPLLLRSPRGGLIVGMTDGDGYHYRGQFIYDLVKVGVTRVAENIVHDLTQYAPTARLTSVAFTPGFLRSEEMLTTFGVTQETWFEAIREHGHSWAASETPRYAGRAIARLVADPNRHDKNGKALATWHLKDEYQLCEPGGRVPGEDADELVALYGASSSQTTEQ
jgi:NAD(P)-dependent dehydrogenase (short-subunit alcohol dehydrogenase family)